MNILICDDVAKDANELAAMLAELAFEIQISVFTCPWQAYNYIKSGVMVDLCFLDILMPAMNGIKFAEKLRESSFAGEIVFLTMSNNFANQSYRVKAFGYMLKPLNREKVINVINSLQNMRANEDKNKLLVKTQGVAMAIPFCDISYVESDRHNVYINLLSKPAVRVYSSFAEIAERLLLDKRFVQCHRSFLINLNEVKTIENNYVAMKSEKKIPISKGYFPVKDIIVKWLFRH